MRWGQVLQAAGVTLTLLAGDMADPQETSAQEIDEIDLDVNVITVSRSKSFWSDLFDNRANRPRRFDYLSGGQPDKLIYFGGIDASQWSFGAFAGMQWMPNGLDRNGFILRMFMSESLERYTDRRINFDTQIGRGYILPGYLVRTGHLEAQFLLGPDAEADFFFQDGRAERWRTRYGLRGIADLWWEPTRELMLQSALSATTIDNGYSARLAAGWKLFDGFWVGPEVAVSRDFFSEQTRLGAHLTGLRTNDYEWSFAAGRVSDNFGRSGVYGRFGIMLRPPRAPFYDN